MSMAELDKAYQLEDQTRGVLQFVNLQTKMFPDAATALGLAVANRDMSQIENLHKTMAKLKQDRRVWMSRGYLDDASLKPFNERVESVIAGIESAEEGARKGDQISFIQGLARLQSKVVKCNEEGDRVIAIQDQKAQEQRAEQQRIRLVLQRLSTGAVVVSILISILMVVIFNRGIANRLKLISKNALDLAADKPIAPPLAGTDEIAQLDGIFHEMAGRLADLRRREKAVTDNASEIICSIDTYFGFSSVNKAVTRLLGYAPEDLLDKPLASICVESAQHVRTIFKDIAEKDGGSKPFQLTIRTSNGELREIMWSAVFDKEEKSYFCVAHDVTEMNKTNRLKRELTAMATHDLRAPLASLQLTLDLFSKNSYGVLNERGAHRAAQSKATIERLVKLISSFLEIDKMESGVVELNIAEVPLPTLLRNASALLQSKAEEKALSFKMENCDLVLNCDGQRLTDVFQNLLDNAIKYSPDKGTVKVVAEKQRDMVLIKVMDQGPGIPPEKQEIIFEKFKQGNVSVSTEKIGTGLGLAICKAIVIAHKGQIGIGNEPGWGAVVWLTLPTAD